MSASAHGSDDAIVHRVVVNHEEQYSIWPVSRPIPAGWRDAGKQGPKADCLAYIATVWTDMRPLSARVPPGDETAIAGSEAAGVQVPVDDLVSRLTSRDHEIDLVLHPDRSVRALRERVERGCLYVRFFGDRGTTDLPIRLAPTATTSESNAQTGTVRVEGSLTVNGVPVVCTVEIATETLRGTGRLRLADQQATTLG